MANQTTTIPKGWKMTTLGEVATTVTDFVANGSFASLKENVEYNYKEDYAVMIRLADYNNNFSNLLYTNKKGYEFLKKSSLNPRDIIISNVGEYSGTVFRAPNLNRPMTLAPNSILVRFDNDSDDYFYFLLKSKNGQSLIDNIKSGSANPKFNKTDFKKIEVIIPQLPEQRAIAAVLSSLDDKIELLREQNKTLEAIAQAIFKEWFVNFNFPGATGKMIDSELGEIPEGWKVGGLIEDKISKFVKTNIDQFDDSKDYVETSNVNLSNFVGNFEKITFLDRPSRANMQPTQNSFWFARMAESRKYLLFQDKDDIESKILSTGFAGIQSIKEYLYFYWCFILSDIFNVLKNQYAEGAVQVAISNSGIQRIKLALPPIEIAKEFTEAVGFCFEKISNNNSQIETLSKLRDTLLPKLMKGDVRVEGFEN